MLLTATLVAALGACGGDSGDGKSGSDVLLTPSSGASTRAPIIETSADPADPAKALIDRVNAGLTATYTVRYTTESEGAPGDEYRVYSLPPLARVDTIEPGGGPALSMTFARDGSLVVTCRRQQQRWDCSELPLERPLLLTASPVVYPEAAELAEATVTSDGGREIAGEPTDCWAVSRDLAAELVTTRYCLTALGAVLFADVNAVAVTAVEFTDSADPEDFVLPTD